MKLWVCLFSLGFSFFSLTNENIGANSDLSNIQLVRRDYSNDFSLDSVSDINNEKKQFKPNVYNHYFRSLFHSEEGNYEKALDDLFKAKEEDPESVYLRLKIATLLIYTGKVEQAEIELIEAKKLSPQSVDVSLALIFVYSYTKQDKALEQEYQTFLESAHTIRPEDIQISEQLAQFYFYKNKLDDAICIYDAILKKDPEYVEALFWLGYLYQEKGLDAKALKMWQHALKNNPNHAPTLNCLGYTYAQEGKHLKEAETMLKKALNIEPENGAYLDSLGWIYFKQSKYQEAEIYLKKALSYLEDAVVYEHMIVLYEALKKKSIAKEYCLKGLAIFPDNQILKNKLETYE